MSGRSPSFTSEEIEILRNVARRLRQQNGWSGAELGRRIGIAQQNAGRFTAAGSSTGMDRATANRLAKAAGYPDATHLLLQEGLTAPQGSKWSDRDRAMNVAKTMGYPEQVIETIVARYRQESFANMNMRWWNDQVVLETAAQKAAGVLEEPPPYSLATGEVAKRKKGTG